MTLKKIQNGVNYLIKRLQDMTNPLPFVSTCGYAVSSLKKLEQTLAGTYLLKLFVTNMYIIVVSLGRIMINV